ncbi:MAG: hypothetical protein M3151_08230, partial [Actinomycetota bacterium]|nr:hypothetical protein [Actinomycetota bacterium]
MGLPSSLRGLTFAGFVTVLLVSLSVISASAQESPNDPVGGFEALAGAEARDYRIPGDVREVWRAEYGGGLTQVRYQQYVGEAKVYGGQVTVLGREGEQVAVTGSHYPGLEPTNEVRLTGREARAIVERERGKEAKYFAELFIDPEDGRRFYEVDSQKFDTRRIYHIAAESGKKIKEYDAIQETGETPSDPAVGVKGDAKQIDTTFNGSVHQLVSGDLRQKTLDARNRQKIPGTLFADADGTWNTAGRTSLGQPAGVDAHYYANVTDDY